jgi:hypothetical protein
VTYFSVLLDAVQNKTKYVRDSEVSFDLGDKKLTKYEFHMVVSASKVALIIVINVLVTVS